MQRPMLRETTRGMLLLCVAAALIAWPQQSMQAAREGLTLCACTIVPSLFPFFVLSALVLKLGVAEYLGRILERIMWPLFRVGGAGAAALVIGLVGGYPVGARTAMELYRDGLCSRTETERLLAFCNNSGPAFILGVVGVGVFGGGRAGLVLYTVHVAASVCVGLLFRFYGAAERCEPQKRPGRTKTVRFSTAFTDSVRTAQGAVLNVCAFVVVFAAVARWLELSGVLGGLARLLAMTGMNVRQAQGLLRGLLEVSSGVTGLEGEGRLTVVAFLLGWAGLSVHCQVLSFLADSGLRTGTYWVGKMLHGALSALFVVLLDVFVPKMLPASNWLGQQAGQEIMLGFTATAGLSVLVAWLLWTVFLTAIACGERNTKKGVEKGN